MSTIFKSWFPFWLRGQGVLCWLGVVCASLFTASLLHAQSPTLDGFAPNLGGSVYSVVVQPDGKVLVGGDFPLRIRRFNPDGSLDANFNSTVNGPVYSLALQADGKVLVGGGFTTMTGLARYGIGRLNADGTLDAAFNPGVTGDFPFVNTLAVQADGKILVGGGFGGLAGVTRANLGRLNTNGTIDTGFTATANWYVNTILVQDDGKILVGGLFDTLGGQSRSLIGRLTDTGGIDANFTPGVSGGFDTAVYSLALQADGKILVGGFFNTLGGQVRTNIGRLNPNGTPDTFNPGADGLVGTMAVQTDGKILAGGNFAALAGQSRTNFGRLNSDGSLDGVFTPQIGGGSFPNIYALVLQADGKICLGGAFDNVNGQPRLSIARLNATDPATQSLSYAGLTINWLRGGTSPEVLTSSFDYSSNGVAWTSVGAGIRLTNGWQRTNATIPAGQTLRARGFSAGASGNQWFVETYSGKPTILQQPVSRTNSYGSAASLYVSVGGTEPLGYQWFRNGLALTNQGNLAGTTSSTLMVSQVSNADEGGYAVVLTNLSGSVTSAVATLTVIDPLITQQPTNAVWSLGGTVTFKVTAVGTPTLGYHWYRDAVAVPGATNASLTLSNLSGVDIGLYTVVVSNLSGMITSQPVGFTIITGVADTTFNPGAGATVYALAVQRDGRILVGGAFTSLGGVPRNFLGRLNADGTIDATFDPGSDSTVKSIALQTNGSILVGGSFTTLGGLSRNHLGRLNSSGMVDTNFNPGVSIFIGQSTVNALAVQADGKIIVGGNFDTLAGGSRNHIGRVSVTGALDSFNPGPSLADNFESVNCVAVQADGKVVVAGAFAQFGGQARTNLARVTSTGGLDAAFNPNLNGQVYTLAVQADGKVLVGGNFTGVGGQAVTNIARLNTNGTLDVAFNPGANSTVYSLAVQADGKILLGGTFTTLGGQSRNRIARLNADGSLDTIFNPGANSSVTALAVQADGKILVGGGFATLAGQSRSRLGRLESTGLATQTLNYATNTITWSRGGTAPEVWRTAFDHSADGINWTVFGAGTRIASGWQRTGATLPTGRTLRAIGQVSGGYGNVSGWFVESYYGRPVVITHPLSQTNGGTTTAMFRVAVGGSEPMAFQWQKGGTNLLNQGNVTGANSNILLLAHVLKADEGAYRVVITNSFGSATSLVVSLTVLNPLVTNQPAGAARNQGESVTFNVGAVGSLPLSYQWFHQGVPLPGATSSSLLLLNLARTNAGYYTVVVTNAEGSITSAPALLTVNVVTADTGFSPAPDISVSSIAIQPDGRILIGGNFSRNGVEEILWRYSPDGAVVEAFTDDSPGYSYAYDALAVQTDGKILVAGFFPTLGGVPHNCIGRFNTNLTLDATFNPSAGTPVGLNEVPEIEGMAVQADGKIVVGGYFTTLVGASRNNIGRLNTNGTLDTFNPGADYYVNTIAVQMDGKILVGGQFGTLGGAARIGIGRINTNGTLDATFNPGVDQPVSAIAVQADGKILVGGYFSTLGGQPMKYLGRLNTNGTVDATFNPSANGRVNSIAVQADGKIIVAGKFTSLGGQTRLFIGRLNSDGTPDPIFNPGASYYVNGVAIQADGKILAGGDFSTIGGYPRQYFARLNNPDLVTESLSRTSTNLVWLRGGGGAEVWRTTFERSTNNGVTWTGLGSGTRIPGGWRVNVTNLPASGILRTRGHVVGGYQNASAWFVESKFDLIPKLQLSLIRSNDLAILSWSGAPGPYQVQHTTNLSDPSSWQNLGGLVQTNSMTLPIGADNRFLRVQAQ